MTDTFNSKTRGWSSLDVARWHMKNSKLTGTSWSIALVIAMHHNKNRGYAFPTIDKLVTDTPFSRRSIARAIQEMKDSGEWHISSGRGGPTSKSQALARANRYYPLPQDDNKSSSTESNTEDIPSNERESGPEDVPFNSEENVTPGSPTSLEQEGSEVPGWHFTHDEINEESGARVAPHSEQSGARVAPHSEQSGARVAPHSEQSGARVAPHPHSEVPGWHPKREYLLKENQTGGAKRETRSLKEEIEGEGRSLSLSNSRAKNATRPTDPPSSLSKKNLKDDDRNLDGSSHDPLAVEGAAFFALLHPTHQTQLSKEWERTSQARKVGFLDESSRWTTQQRVWLEINSRESVRRSEKVQSLLGWLVKFAVVYQPRSGKQKPRNPDPDQTTSAEGYAKPF